MRRILYLAFILLLLLPWAQKSMKLFKLKPLDGYVAESEVKQPTLNWENWQSSSFQQYISNRTREKIGLKQVLIRIINQFRYSLFNTANTNGVLVLEDNFIMPLDYVNSLMGEDYIGQDSLVKFATKTKFIQDELKAQNKEFFILIAPGKPSLYPEIIPKFYHPKLDSAVTNYDTFTDMLDQMNVEYLDLKQAIINHKTEFKFPIFPKQGVHWSGNTVAYATDTLLDYIKHRGTVATGNIKLGSGEKTVNNYRFTDYDIGESMNLLWSIADDTLHYPTMEIVQNNKPKPTLLGVGDSFFQSFVYFYPTFDSLFSADSKFWFYNKKIEWPSEYRDAYFEVKYLSLKKEIDKSDIIIIQMTEQNIAQTGYLFVDNLYAILKSKSLTDLDFSAKKLSDEEIEKAQQLAEKVGISAVELENNLKENKLIAELQGGEKAQIDAILQTMLKNEQWMKNLTRQAKEKNISLEENMLINAKWVLENE